MGTIVVTENATLDGVIEQVDDWFSPAGGDTGTDDSDIVTTLREQMRTQAALLLGRRTFESFRGYWPTRTGDTTGITDHLNRVPRYVLSWWIWRCPQCRGPLGTTIFPVQCPRCATRLRSGGGEAAWPC